MSPRARIATSLLAVAAIVAIAALLVIGAAANTASSACGAATDATYLADAFAPAYQISVGEHDGNAVHVAAHTIESDQVLIAAVADDDLAAVRSEVLALVFNHEHIVRLRVLRGGLVDVGGPLVLAPVRGLLRRGGQVVGSFVMSVQDDAGYRKLAERLTGAHVVMRYRGATLMSDLAATPASLPGRGAVLVDGVHYLAESFDDGRFPSGTLRITLLFARPPAALARSDCAQIGADVLAAVARRAYLESVSGPPVVPAQTTLALDQALPQALAAGDYAGAARIVRGMVAGGGFARLWVSVGRRVIARAGLAGAALAPLQRPIRDASGALLAHALFAVQSVRSYVVLAEALTGAAVLVRSAGGQLAGTFTGPSRVPRSGRLRYRGRRYTVASFTATRFPRGRVTIYVLAPDAARA